MNNLKKTMLKKFASVSKWVAGSVSCTGMHQPKAL